ncbi:MAG TPA: heme biosynthesis HemY N-terminal domain-containing protein [Dongiaceae bacterium]
MIRLVLWLAGIVAIAGLFTWLADRPGVLTVDWLGYRIETPVVVAAVALLAVLILINATYGLMRRTWQAPGAVAEFFRSRRNRRGYEALSRGIVAVGAGDLVAARKQALIASRVLDDEPLTKVLEAQTAQLAGDGARVQSIFADMARAPETRLLGLRGLFRRARADGDRVQARKIAEQALEQNPGLPWASAAMLALQSYDKDWNGAARTLESQRRFHLIDEETARRKQAVVLTAQAMELEKTNPGDALALALKAHRLDPSFVPAAMIAGRCHAQKGQARKAARLIEQAWSRHPHAGLARIYAFQKPEAPAPERLKRVRELLEHAEGGEEGAVALAQAALEAREWPAAREALVPYTSSAPNSRICALMAEIAEGEGDKGLAREWLARAVRAPRGPQWTADGFVADEWLPASPVTGELGVFQWKVPVEGLAIEAPDEPPPVAEPQALPHGGEVKARPELPAIEQPPHQAQPTTAAAPPVAVPKNPGPLPPPPDDPGPPREDSVVRPPHAWQGTGRF